MASPLLALFVQSLSQDGYGKPTYWARAGLCGLTLFLLFLVSQENFSGGAPGLNFFICIVTLHMVAISLVGLSYFGSAIAEEKEEQTLGLLRMTDLNPVSILLGKSTSRLCGALLLIAAGFPFTTFAVTLGGVSLGQIFAAYGAMAAYTFLLCNVALLGSVIARRTTGAATFTAVVIGILVGVGPLLWQVDAGLEKFGVASGLRPIGDTMWNTTPIARLTEILTTGFSGSPICSQVKTDFALGAGCFFLAWAAFERFCDRSPDESTGGTGKFMRVLGMKVRRPPRPQAHPLAWKEYYFLLDGNPGLTLRVFGYLVAPVVTFGILFYATDSDAGGVSSFFSTWITVVFYLDTGAMAARVFRSELNDQTLAALAILPSTIRQIAYRKARILILVSIPGMVAIVGIELLQRWFYSFQSGYPSIYGPVMIQALAPVINVVLFVHLVIWFSLIVKRGALPLGIVATLTLIVFTSIIGSYCAQSFFKLFGYAPGFAWAFYMFVASAIINVPLSVLLHFRSLRRLEALVGEG